MDGIADSLVLAVILQPLCRISSQGSGTGSINTRAQSVSITRFAKITAWIHPSGRARYRARSNHTRRWTVWICTITDVFNGVFDLDTGGWDEEPTFYRKHRSERQHAKHRRQRYRCHSDESQGSFLWVAQSTRTGTAASEPRHARSAPVKTGDDGIILVVHLYLERGTLTFTKPKSTIKSQGCIYSLP